MVKALSSYGPVRVHVIGLVVPRGDRRGCGGGAPVRGRRGRGRSAPHSAVARAGRGGSCAGEEGTGCPLLLRPPMGLRAAAREYEMTFSLCNSDYVKCTLESRQPLSL